MTHGTSSAGEIRRETLRQNEGTEYLHLPRRRPRGERMPPGRRLLRGGGPTALGPVTNGLPAHVWVVAVFNWRPQPLPARNVHARGIRLRLRTRFVCPLRSPGRRQDDEIRAQLLERDICVTQSVRLRHGPRIASSVATFPLSRHDLLRSRSLTLHEWTPTPGPDIGIWKGDLLRTDAPGVCWRLRSRFSDSAGDGRPPDGHDRPNWPEFPEFEALKRSQPHRRPLEAQ